MNVFALIVGGGLAGAALVAYVAHRVGDSRRSRAGAARITLSSIPEGIVRAKRGRRRVLVAFVDPGDEASRALLDHVTGSPDLESGIRHFELVRIEAREEDRQVVGHLAAKYGLDTLAVPTLLALDIEGQKVGALEGAEAAPAKVSAFIDMVKPGG